MPHHRAPQAAAERTHRTVLDELDVTRRWGLAVTTPARTVIDLSATVGAPLLQRVFDDLARRRHLRPADLERRLDDPTPLPRHRRDLLDGLLGRRRGQRPGGSAGEDRMVEVLVAAGLPPPERSVLVVVGDAVYELDAAWPQQRVAIEHDSWWVHGDRSHFERDRLRAARLQASGWSVLQVTPAWSDEELVAVVRRALAQRCRPREGGAG